MHVFLIYLLNFSIYFLNGNHLLPTLFIKKVGFVSSWNKGKCCPGPSNRPSQQFKLHPISWKYPIIDYLGHDLNDLEILLRSRRRSPWSFGFQTYHWECDKKTRSRYSDFWHHLAASWNNNIKKKWLKQRIYRDVSDIKSCLSCENLNFCFSVQSELF